MIVQPIPRRIAAVNTLAIADDPPWTLKNYAASNFGTVRREWKDRNARLYYRFEDSSVDNLADKASVALDHYFVKNRTPSGTMVPSGGEVGVILLSDSRDHGDEGFLPRGKTIDILLVGALVAAFVAGRSLRRRH